MESGSPIFVQARKPYGMHTQTESGNKNRTARDTEFILANIASHISPTETEAAIFLSKLETVSKDFSVTSAECIYRSETH